MQEAPAIRHSRGSRALAAVAAALSAAVEPGAGERLELATAALAAGGGSAALYRLDGARFVAVAGDASTPTIEPGERRSRKLRSGAAAGSLLPLRARGRTVGALELHDVPPLTTEELRTVRRAFTCVLDRERPPTGRPEHAHLVQGGRLAAVGALTPRLVHDLANPLFGIVGLCEFLLDELEPGTRAHERVRLIHDSGVELKAIVGRMRTLTSDRSPRRLLPLHDVVREMVELLRSSGAADGVAIGERYRGRPVVWARSADVKTAVLALLLNGVQAAGAGGAVHVEGAAGRRTASVTVSDDGGGATAEAAARAFEPFFSTWSRPGLGLPSARAAARAHGGDVVLVQATPSARFRLSLPLAPTT